MLYSYFINFTIEINLKLVEIVLGNKINQLINEIRLKKKTFIYLSGDTENFFFVVVVIYALCF